MSDYAPLVSIIVNTHNNLQYLPEAIESAFNQTYPHTEIIIYDNASTDDIRSFAEQFGERVRYYRSDRFLTLGQARNDAMKMAKGDLIDFLDSDDIFLPNKLERQAPLFADERVGLVYSQCIQLENLNGKTREFLISWVRDAPEDGEMFGRLLEYFGIPFPTAIFRKAAIGDDPSKWFPETFHICTDYELFLKISLKYLIRYVDEPLAKWRFHGQN
ncbi:MAG: glycosyltransferase family 2 protein, partial [Planctomycetes bacterium]|nr:glycosyltransferase family 2 protein [Planctomycetota bacterium]